MEAFGIESIFFTTTPVLYKFDSDLLYQTSIILTLIINAEKRDCQVKYIYKVFFRRSTMLAAVISAGY
jgi:hypothetical protein